MAAAALIDRNDSPTDAQIDAAITNICRCGIYPRLRESIRRAIRIKAGREQVDGAPPPGIAPGTRPARCPRCARRRRRRGRQGVDFLSRLLTGRFSNRSSAHRRTGRPSTRLAIGAAGR